MLNVSKEEKAPSLLSFFVDYQVSNVLVLGAAVQRTSYFQFLMTPVTSKSTLNSAEAQGGVMA